MPNVDLFEMTLRVLHRTSGALVLVFFVLHIANHIAALSSVASHIAFMDVARLVYRKSIVEAFLLLCVGIQVVSGLWFVMRRWRQRSGLISCLQALSGAYMAFFFLVHVGAVIFGRSVLHLDTNFYFAAAGLHVKPFQYIFATYYFLAVLAFFIHVGCAVYWQMQASSSAAKTLAVVLSALIGCIVSLGIVLALAGVLHPFEVPAQYKATYGGISD